MQHQNFYHFLFNPRHTHADLKPYILDISTLILHLIYTNHFITVTI